MKIYPNTKIYIIYPGNINSGEPELCHQFCSQLIQFGVNAFMNQLFAKHLNKFVLQKYLTKLKPKVRECFCQREEKNRARHHRETLLDFAFIKSFGCL